MNTANHGFYIALAYGVSGLLVAAELLLLWRRCQRTRSLQRGNDA
jgi:heme exporter protein CcmD